ncbi:MAG: hypothetical protein KBG20_06820 [Caldilineaceae bacterium]|nr:hypothetical protein [Caldilineaceae bacterium]MBP8106480.1 hypothetical protein [Caldilineaceae bacterium]MBP8121262.1 hypothetical protein [Caldilineaceae bacterium]MBP9071991.1 hypothetical protein [Caldilineaceae bacterium]
MSLILPLLTALSAALTVTMIARRLNLGIGPSVSRTLADYLDVQADAPRPLAVNPSAVILLSLGLPPDPRWLVGIRIASGVLPALGLMLLGFPLLPSAGGGALTAVLAHSMLQSRWRAFRVQVEQELPTFVSRLAGTLLVTQSPQAALQEVTDTLPDGSPLAAWMQRLLTDLRSAGPQAMIAAQADAAELSPSLALVLFQLRRFFETGGSGFTRAFSTTASELSAILEARAVAGSKAEAARSAVLTMLAIIGGILLLLLSSPSVQMGFREPMVQLIAAACLGTMGFGYLWLNGMIEEAME